MDVEAYIRRKEKAKQWHHAVQRYVVLRRKDGLACVWDIPRSTRVSRWLRPENAERVCNDVEHSWNHGGGVCIWVEKIGDAHAA